VPIIIIVIFITTTIIIFITTIIIIITIIITTTIIIIIIIIPIFALRCQGGWNGYGGGAVWFKGGNLGVEGCDFETNVAHEVSGAPSLSDSVATLNSRAHENESRGLP
jgi:hypothetical protein